MSMREIDISRAIVESYREKLLDYLQSDVAIVGAGPAGLTASYFLAKAGIKTVVLERRLSTGGGIWGGGMGCNVVVVEHTGVLDEIGVRSQKCGDLYTADAVELAAALTYKALQAGAWIFNLCEAEDLIVKGGEVKGVVINATPIVMAGLHVDPICAACRKIVDATGHAAEMLGILKAKLKSFHPEEIAEGFMDVESAEEGVVERTGEVYPGLYVAGMSVCAAYNLPRMGPIFGGMLDSGKKAADLIIKAMGT